MLRADVPPRNGCGQLGARCGDVQADSRVQMRETRRDEGRFVDKVSREFVSAAALIAAAAAFTFGQGARIRRCSTMVRVGSHTAKRTRSRCKISRGARAGAQGKLTARRARPACSRCGDLTSSHANLELKILGRGSRRATPIL